MIIHTASEGISLARKLESDSALFYESLAQKYAKDSETFLAFVKENKKNIAQIERTYFGVITDAIEGSYAFNLETDNYSLDSTVTINTDYVDMLKQAVQVEEQIIRFYKDAAEQSRALMADIPRVFDILARKRRERVEKLKTLTA